MKNDTWSRSWRKKVTWDKENKIYLYKGYEIFPLSFQEQIKMPVHLQNEYYWSEINHIEKILELNNKRAKMNIETEQSDFDEAMNIFWESIGLGL